MKISILGSGNFATALATVLVKNNHEILMWTIKDDEHASINDLQIHPYIGYSKKLSKNIKASKNIQEVINFSDTIILSVPSYVLEDVINLALPFLNDKNKKAFVNTAKGFHPGSLMLISDYLAKKIPVNSRKLISTIIGPTFAIEILNNKITAANLVFDNIKEAQKVISYFNCDTFKLYLCNDTSGAEFLSSFKNMIAIGAGMIYGYGMEMNSKAILLTKAFNESRYLLEQLNYNPDTVNELCGFGDLLLTCGSSKSRNFQTGLKIAELNSFNSALLNLKNNNITIEGIGNALIIEKIINKKKININKISITNTIINIFNGKIKNIENALKKSLIT